MSDKVIDIPGIGPTAFPDSMTPDAINAASAKLYADANPKHPPADPKHSWIDTATDWLPAAGGAVGGLVGGIGGTVAGFGVGGVPGAVGGAAVGGAGGEAARQLINRARGAAAPSSASDAAAGVAKEAAIQGGSEAVGAGIGAGMKAVAPKLMQSAVKPTLAMMKDHPAAKLVQTLLDEGISVTQSGLDKLHGLLSATNDEIRAAVNGSSARISTGDVADRLTDVTRRVANQVNPDKDLRAVEAVGQEFRNHPRFAGPNGSVNLTTPVQTAQDLKVGTYQQLKGKYGEMSSASAEAQKALARGLKEEIAKEVPGIAELNSKDSDLIAAIDAVGRRVAFSGNKDPIGFTWVTQHPTTFIASLLDKSPAVKSMLARGMYQSAATVAKVSPQLVRAAVAALATHGPDAAPARESDGK